jgi:FkbH-like protein
MQRGEMYQAQLVRGEYASSFHNLEDFLNSLELEVAIEPARSLSISRIAQLTQRTNQMNLTTRRYTEAQVEALARDPEWHVFSLAAKDRFGDHGVIGVMFLNMRANHCHIDTLLLSCRVLGLKLEQYMLAFAAAVAKGDNKERIVGEYIPTAKNKVVADLYPKFGFRKLSDTLFEAAPEDPIFEAPRHIRPPPEHFLSALAPASSRIQ